MFINVNYYKPKSWNDCRTGLLGKTVWVSNGQQFACTSKKCKSKHCIRFQTQIEANIRKVNYYYLKPDYFVVLRLENINFALNWLQMSWLMKCLKKKLKDDAKAIVFEFKNECIIEFDDDIKPHIHMMIKNHGNNGRQEIELEFKKFLQNVWNCSIEKFKQKYEEEYKDDDNQLAKINGVFGSVYCKKVISAKGSAIYLSKGEKYIHKYNPVPEGWNTSKCHIVSRSRGILVKPKKELLSIYYQNREFFREWESKPDKGKQINDPYSSTDSETKKVTEKNELNKDSVNLINKVGRFVKSITRTWVRKILLFATFGFSLIGSLVFGLKKNEVQPVKPKDFIEKEINQKQPVKINNKWLVRPKKE